MHTIAGVLRPMPAFTGYLHANRQPRLAEAAPWHTAISLAISCHGWHESVIHKLAELQVIYAVSSSGGGLFGRPVTRKSSGRFSFLARFSNRSQDGEIPNRCGNHDLDWPDPPVRKSLSALRLAF